MLGVEFMLKFRRPGNVGEVISCFLDLINKLEVHIRLKGRESESIKTAVQGVEAYCLKLEGQITAKDEVIEALEKKFAELEERVSELE